MEHRGRRPAHPLGRQRTAHLAQGMHRSVEKIYAPLPSYDQHTGPLLELFAAPAATLLSHIQTTEAPKRTPRRRHYTFHYTFHSAASPIRSPGGHVSLTIQGVVGGGR